MPAHVLGRRRRGRHRNKKGACRYCHEGFHQHTSPLDGLHAVLPTKYWIFQRQGGRPPATPIGPQWHCLSAFWLIPGKPLSWAQLTSGANASGTLTVSSGAAVETL